VPARTPPVAVRPRYRLGRRRAQPPRQPARGNHSLPGLWIMPQGCCPACPMPCARDHAGEGLKRKPAGRRQPPPSPARSGTQWGARFAEPESAKRLRRAKPPAGARSAEVVLGHAGTGQQSPTRQAGRTRTQSRRCRLPRSPARESGQVLDPRSRGDSVIPRSIHRQFTMSDGHRPRHSASYEQARPCLSPTDCRTVKAPAMSDQQGRFVVAADVAFKAAGRSALPAPWGRQRR
jgi:hypothetical protein